MAGLGLFTLAKWQTVATVAAVLFRSIGGPTLVSSALRTPGYIFGHGVRAIEWDVESCPHTPSDRMVRRQPSYA